MCIFFISLSLCFLIFCLDSLSCIFFFFLGLLSGYSLSLCVSFTFSLVRFRLLYSPSLLFFFIRLFISLTGFYFKKFFIFSPLFRACLAFIFSLLLSFFSSLFFPCYSLCYPYSYSLCLLASFFVILSLSFSLIISLYFHLILFTFVSHPHSFSLCLSPLFFDHVTSHLSFSFFFHSFFYLIPMR